MALERFIPKSPDIFIRNSQDFEVAKFGHLNTIVEYINNNTVQPAGLNGYVQFNNNNALGGDAGLFWDNVNKRLGVGTVIPATTFQVNGVQALTNADLTGYPLYSIFNIVRNGATSIALDRFTGAPHFNFRAAGGTIASPTTQVGELGNIGWWSYSGTAFNRNVLLIARAENFVGGLAQTQRLSIGMGDSGSGNDYYYEMVNGNSYFGPSAYGSTPTARVQIKGSGQTSGTTSLLVQNSIGSDSLRVYDDRIVEVPYRIQTPFIRNQSGNLVLYSGSFEIEIQSNNPTSGSGSLRTTGDITTTDNQTKSIINVNNLVSSTPAAFNTLNGFAFTSTITQTTGTIRGLFINPTLNASTDFRAIETVRGNVLLATTSGNVGIGTTNPFALLTVGGQSSFYSVQSAGTGSDFFYSDINPNITAGANNQVVSLMRLRDRGVLNTGGFTGTQRLSLIMENGAGGQFPFQLFSESGALRIGYSTIATPTAKLEIRGSGSTSATTSLLVQNSAGNRLLEIKDDGLLYIGTTASNLGQILVPHSSTYAERVFLSIQTGVNLLSTLSNDGLGFKANYNIFDGSIRNNSGAYGGANTSTGLSTQSYNFYNEIQFYGVGTDSSLLNFTGGGRIQGGAVGQYIKISGNMQLDSLANKLKGFYFNPTLTGTYSTQTVFAIHSTYGGAYLNTATPQASAILQADSTTQGFLPPRMTTAQRVAITSPAASLIVFDTTIQNICYYRDGVWVQATFAAV